MILNNFNGLLHKIWPVLLPIWGATAIWAVAKSVKEIRAK
jgi:hypothetical protein